MQHFHSALIRLTGLYVVILMILALACSVWLYNIAGNEVTFLYKTVTQNVTTPNAEAVAGSVAQESSKQRMLQSLLFFNLFILGAGTLASYALAKHTLKPIQESYEAQAHFAAEASHELRTPLTALKAELQLAQHTDARSPKSSQAVIASSLQEVERLTALTERLLRLTELDFNSDNEATNLHSAIHKALETLRPLSTEKNISITVPKAEVQLAIHSDDLVELFIIVLHNALKYSPSHARITITCTRQHNNYELRVHDHGPGIPPEDLPHIFEHFYRGKRFTRQTEGFGLGLAVAKKLVSRANGYISAESRPGDTTIIIHIPAATSV